MHSGRATALAALLLATAPLLAQTDALAARVDKVLEEVPLVDGHNDLPWQFRERAGNRISAIDLRSDQSALEPALHTDIPRLRRGRVGGQFWSVYVPAELRGADAVQATLEQMDVARRMTAAYPDVFEIALTADDVVRIHKSGKVASLMGMEGGHSINNSLGALRELYRGGARYMTLTHSKNNDWADSATDVPLHAGLTDFGVAVVREMNRLGMLVDLSHVSQATMNEVLDVAAAPPIFSHSSARAVTDHPRNVPDQVLERLKTTDGVVMVTWVPGFVSEKVRRHRVEFLAAEARLKATMEGHWPDDVKKALAAWRAANPAPRATISDVADHVDHVRKVAGIDHIGIGADLDGISTTPEGLESVAAYPALFRELARRGYSDLDLKKIAGLNLLRVMRKVETVAARLQKERAPGEELFAPSKRVEE